MASRFFVLWFQSEKIFESEYFTTGLPNRLNLKLFERKGPRPFMIGQADLGDFSATSASPNCQSSMFERQECEAARAARSMRLDFLGNTKSHLYWYFRSMEIPTDWFVSKTIWEIADLEIPRAVVSFTRSLPMRRQPGHKMAQFTHLTGMPSGAHPPDSAGIWVRFFFQCCIRDVPKNAISERRKLFTSSTSGVVFRRNG